MQKYFFFNNRTILCLSVFLFFALLLSACQPAIEPLHYGGQVYAEELLLQGMDAWSPYGMSIEHVIFKNPDDLTKAFLSGVVDVALLSDIQAAQVFIQMGDKAVIIAVSERGDRMSTLVRADSDILSWADLQGKRVALRSGSGVELALKRYFALHPELDWDAVEWFNLPAEDMPAALASGAVDAITALEPIPAMAQAAGGTRVLASYGACCPAPLVLVANSKFAKENPEMIVAFLRGHQDKAALIQSDSAQAARMAAVQAANFDLVIPASTFHIVFKRIDYAMEIDTPVISALEETAQDLLEAGLIEHAPEFFFDSGYLESMPE